MLWLLVILWTFIHIPSAQAEGSKDLYPSGASGGRAYLRASTTESAAFPFPTLGTHYVYAEAGEQIALASNAQSGSNKRIYLYGPDGNEITLTFSPGAGNIPNRNAELAGPRLPGQGSGGNRYAPIFYTVPAGKDGIYKIEFRGTSNSTTGDNRLPYSSADSWPTGPGVNSSNYLIAWDISVARQTGGIWNWVDGRVYTNVLNMDNPSYGGTTGNDSSNFRPNSGFHGKFKVLTRDGFVYNVDNNGSQGISFTFMVNNRGFHEIGSPDTPSYQSIAASTAGAVHNRYHDPRSVDGPAAVTQKIFYSLPDGNMPEMALGGPVANAQTWLRIPEKQLDVDEIIVEGVEGTPYQLGNKGAYIKFYNESGGDYYIEIRPQPGSSTSFPTRQMSGPSAIGENQIFWDGKDGAGNPLPNGLADVEVELKLRGAEVHFPYIDMELNHFGIVIELYETDLLSIKSNKVFWNDTAIGNGGGSSGSKSNPRNASHDAIPNGTPSSGTGANGHIWGTGSNATSGTFGDTMGMDTWTFIEGDAITIQIEVDVRVADLMITSIVPNKTEVIEGDEITWYVNVKNDGPHDVEDATFGFTIPEGFNPGAVEFFGNGCGTESLGITYDPLTRTFSSELDLPDGCEVLYKIKVTATGAVTPGDQEFEATILRPNDVTDPDATNPDPTIPPTDPHYECQNNGLGGVCNNIKSKNISFNLLANCYEDIEGEFFSWRYSQASAPSNPIIHHITQPPTNAGFTFDIFELDNSFNMEINGVLMAVEELEFQISGTAGQTVRFADGSYWEDGTIEDIWKLRGTTNKPIVRVVIDASGNISLYGSKVSHTHPEYELEPLILVNGNAFNTIVWNTSSNNEIEVIQSVIGDTVMDGYGSGKNLIPCKTYELEKIGVFNDENGNGYADVGETITYTLRVINLGDIDIKDIVLEDPLLGGVITVTPSGDLNNDGILNTDEIWEYEVSYSVTQNDIDNEGVYNLATVSGKNLIDEDMDPVTSTDPDPLDPSDPNYDPACPDCTFVPLVKGRGFLITNPMIYQKMKRN